MVMVEALTSLTAKEAETANAVFEIGFSDLVRLSGAKISDVARK